MNQLELSVKLKLAAEQFINEANRAGAEFKAALGGIEQTAGKAGSGVESGFGKTRQGLQSISQQLQQTKNELIAFFSLQYGAELAISIIKTADAFSGLQSRLKLATTSAEEYATAQKQLFDLSQRTATSMESNVVLYGRIAASMRDMGMAQQDTLNFTEAVAQSMRISGASAETAKAGITQLAQAMASGVLRGDEFNSVMENSPRLAQALAAGLGEPIGALRAMAEAGQLTAEKVTNALLSQKDVLAREYAGMGLTVSAAMTQLSNAWQKYIGEADQANGATKSLSAVISDISKNFNAYAETVLSVGKDALGVLVAFGAVKMGAAVLEFGLLVNSIRSAGAASIEKSAADMAAIKSTIALAAAEKSAASAIVESAHAHQVAAAASEERVLAERNLAFARLATEAADKLSAITAAESAAANKAASLAAAESATVVSGLLAKEAAAHSAVAAAALASAESTLASAKSMALYGETMAAAERGVAVARTALAASTEKATLAEAAFVAAAEKSKLASTANAAASRFLDIAKSASIVTSEKLALATKAEAVATEKSTVALASNATAVAGIGSASGAAVAPVGLLTGAFGLLNKAFDPLLLAFMAYEAVLKPLGTWMGEFAAKLVVGGTASTKFGGETKAAMEVAAEATRVAREETAKLAAEIARSNQLNAFEKLGESAESAKLKIEIAMAGIVADFAEVYAKAQDTEKALDALFKGVNFSAPSSLVAMQSALETLEKTAYATGEQIKNGLGRALDKLSAEELKRFQIAAEAAFSGAAESADKLAAILDASLGSAFRRLGGDIEKFRTGIDQATKEAIGAFEAVAENARASGREIGEAFNLALKTADTRQEVNALGESLKKAAADGVISGKDLEDAQSRLAAKVRETAGEVDGALGDAFKRAGIKSKEELAAIAEQAKKDFEAIRDSGQATAEGVAEAEKKWKDAEAAAQGTATAAEQVAEETENAKDQADELAKSEKVAEESAKAHNEVMKQMGEAIDTARELWVKTGLSTEQAQQKVETYVKTANTVGEIFDGYDRAAKEAQQAIDNMAESIKTTEERADRLGFAASSLKASFDAASQAAQDMALGMESAAQSALGAMIAMTGNKELDAAHMREVQAAQALAAAYKEIERSARSAAKSAEDAVRGFMSSSRSIHEELLQAQGKEDEAAKSRFDARKRDLQLQYAQLQIQIKIAQVQAQAAGIKDSGLEKVAADAASAYGQAMKDLEALEALDSAKRQQDKAAADNAARESAAKVAADQMIDRARGNSGGMGGFEQQAADVAAGAAGSAGASSIINNNLTINFDGTDLSEDQIRNKIAPTLTKMMNGAR